MKSSPTIANLVAALVSIQPQLKPLIRDSRNPDFGSKYVSLEGAMEVRDLLATAGLTTLQPSCSAIYGADKMIAMEVETVLAHKSGEWISGPCVVPLLGRRLKGGGFGEADAQSAGSAITYARRYGVLAILCMVGDDDDDANTVSYDQTVPYDQRPRYSTAPVQQTQPPVTPQGPFPPPPQRPPQQPAQQQLPLGPGLPPGFKCERCGSEEFYDNRNDKRGPRSPDFRCKKCRTGVWLTDQGDDKRFEEWNRRLQAGAQQRPPQTVPAGAPPNDGYAPDEGPPDEEFYRR